jgi:EAL domain-containing protein (putative c-di-GMP-specific phosphodiesterase class I)/ActR/RegA family two-component response regulator
MGLPPVEIINEQSGSSKPVAYVLDDDRQIGILVTRMLSSLGFVSLTFTDASECLQQCKTAKGYAKPTLIVLDLSLGNSDGIDVIDQLRTIAYKGRVLLISGSSETTLLDVQKMAAARGLAMLPSLKKPFRVDALKESLDASPEENLGFITETSPETSKATVIWAVSNGKLELRYQLKYDLKTSTPCGADALFYTRHPSEGIAPLSNSLPPANSPLYGPLARFAISQIATDWKENFRNLKVPFRISIKLPLTFVSSAGFIPLIRQHMPTDPQFSGITIDAIDWKLFDGEDLLREICIQLGLYRVNLAVDDVGSIYSAISRSQNSPFSELRLLPAFVSNCWTDDSKKALCKNVIDLAHSAGVSVCAVGVSSREDLHALTELGCDTAIGNVFGQSQLVEVIASTLLGPKAATEPSQNADDDPYAWPTASVGA